jgi:hypothetical protein
MKHKSLSAVIGGMLALAAMSATAGPILVAEWESPNSGAGLEFAFAAAGIAAYNVANDPDLPALAGTTAVTIQNTSIATFAPNDEKIIEWTAPATYDYFYVLSKYGQGQANFDTALHYVLAGETLTYNPGGNSAPNGLSHVSIWAGRLPTVAVSDSGWSLGLLGLGVFGLSRFRR